MLYKTKKTPTVLVIVTGAFLSLSIGLFATNTIANNGGTWCAPTSASAKKNPVVANAASIQRGKIIYHKECISCHGIKGLGNGPKANDLIKRPSNLASHQVQSQSDGAIFWKITQGNKPMPTFRMAYSDHDRWSVVNYLRTLGK